MMERTLGREFYFSEGIFAGEKERIFCREWFCAGREEKLSDAGDYLSRELIYPNLMISLSADHVTAYTLWPREPAQTRVVCDFLFHPSEIDLPWFNPENAVNFWGLVNRQDWAICENVPRGMRSRMFQSGYYAPMESASLDIRRYINEKLAADERMHPLRGYPTQTQKSLATDEHG